MICINAAMLHDRLIEFVTSIEDPKIEFIKKQGMELQFKSDDEQKAAVVCKQTLKATPEFKTVYFQIHVK